jgi:hypothetical protein
VSSFGKPEARTSEAPCKINKQTKSFPATKLLCYFFLCVLLCFDLLFDVSPPVQKHQGALEQGHPNP